MKEYIDISMKAALKTTLQINRMSLLKVLDKAVTKVPSNMQSVSRALYSQSYSQL